MNIFFKRHGTSTCRQKKSFIGIFTFFCFLGAKFRIIKPQNTHTDKELLALLRRGERDAFNEVYDRYWLKLYKSAFEKLQSSDEAEDMVQDLFISLWMKRESLIINISLSAYLTAAIKYKIINHIAANIVKRNYLQTLRKAVIDYDNCTVDSILLKDAENWINSGINKLSPKVRRVFELSRKENLSNNEIAYKLKVSDQTVKNQISKALKILRLHINNASACSMFLLFLMNKESLFLLLFSLH